MMMEREEVGKEQRRKNGCWRGDGRKKGGRTSMELKDVFVDLKTVFMYIIVSLITKTKMI